MRSSHADCGLFFLTNVCYSSGAGRPRLSCIPDWYHFGMSTQIAVRLPDEIVAFLDDEVREQHAPSRAAVVLRALERERRRQIAARDAAILARLGPDADMDSLAGFAAELQVGLD